MTDIEEVLSHFPNADERMKTSALFNRVINCLVNDADPYLLIGQLITTVDEIQAAYSNLLIKTPVQYIVADKETIEKLKSETNK